MKKHVLVDLWEKVAVAESPLQRNLRNEGIYNHYLWLKSEPVFYYLLQRARQTDSVKFGGAAKFFQEHCLPQITKRELFYLYELAYQKELAYWSHSPADSNPFTRTPEEEKLDRYLRSIFDYNPGSNKNSFDIQQVPCFPEKFGKVLIGPYAVDIFLFGFRPEHGVLSQDGLRRPKYVATAIEVNGLVHEEALKLRKDQYLRAALDYHNIYTVELTNQEVSKGLCSSLIRNFKSIMGGFKNATDPRTTLDLKLKICMRTAATHLSLSEMDYILRERFGKVFRLEFGFELFLDSNTRLRAKRQLSEKKRIADSLRRISRPTSMGSSKNEFPAFRYLIRNGIPQSNSQIVDKVCLDDLQASEPPETIEVSVDEILNMNHEEVLGLARAIGAPGVEGIKSIRVLRNKILEYMRYAMIVD